jgi:nucleoid-associated protein YgaU
VLAIGIAAAAGTAIGLSLGTRQGGPLSGQGAANGRPTIVVATVPPSVSASPTASPIAPKTVAAATAPPGAVEYVVKPGDTLRSIAQEQYGDAEQWPRIYDANRDAIGPDPDALKAGTTLQLPQ